MSGLWSLEAVLAFAALSLALGCGGTPKPSAREPEARRASRVTWDAAGLRVALSREAKSVCVLEQGCPEGPKGAIRIRPLAEPIRDAVADALLALGFELVDDVEAERDIVADVEWRGTDTIAVRLQDAHGRFIEQASFRRSLARCRELPELSWDSCWAANFEPMKAALTQPLEQSAALLAFARKTKRVATGDPEIAASSETPRRSAPVSNDGLSTAGLDASQLERTVARYRRDIERDCWSPARDARDPSAPRAARVSTVVSISADGSVDEVTSAGDPPGYLHLAPCIVSQVRRWQFPAAQRPTRVNIPFVFAGD